MTSRDRLYVLALSDTTRDLIRLRHREHELIDRIDSLVDALAPPASRPTERRLGEGEGIEEFRDERH